MSGVEIFQLLDSLPCGSRLEEDVLALVKAAAAKSASATAAPSSSSSSSSSAKHTGGCSVRISKEEYLSGLLGHRTEEADPLGLRRKRRTAGGAVKMVRARARGLLLAKQWMGGGVLGGAGQRVGEAAAVEAA